MDLLQVEVSVLYRSPANLLRKDIYQAVVPQSGCRYMESGVFRTS
jgi:hypothetical protein